MAARRSNAGRRSDVICLCWDSAKERCSLTLPNLKLDGGVRQFCRDILRDFREKFSLNLVSLRSVDPVHRKLIYLGSDGAGIGQLRQPVLDWSDSGNLSGAAVESRTVTFFEDIGKRYSGRRYAHPWLVSDMGLKSFISIPVLNTCNINQVLLLLNLYPSPTSPKFDRRELARLGESLAIRFEGFLRDRCQRYATRLSIAIAKLKKRDPDRIYDTLTKVLQQSVGGCSAGIYVERWGGEGIELQSARGAGFQGNLRSEIDHLSDRCWQSNREFLTIRAREGAPVYPRELLPYVPDLVERTASTVFVPLRDLAGRAKGVFCCMKGIDPEPDPTTLYPFTYEDIAVIEAIGQAFVPQLEILMADYRRTQSMNKLAHELRVPLVAFGAAEERIRRECREFRYTFKHDYFEELELYRDVMRRLLKTVDLVRIGPEHVPLSPRKTYLHMDIIAPAVRFVRPLLRRKRLNPKKIQYGGVKTIPPLHVDRALMTQVVFNLMDNAIKYSRKDKPAAFVLEIEGKVTSHDFEIAFRDSGVGVPETWEDRIFEPGVRGVHACQHDPMGEGFGLWFAREIVRRHGGELILRNRVEPTEFVIVLPSSLAQEPPKDSRTRE